MWRRSFWNSFDQTNCSSNSVYFYFLFFLIGSLEMILSITLCFDLQLVLYADDKKKFTINHNIFSLALFSELLYFLFARMYTGIQYWKHNDHKNKCHRVTAILIHWVATILPSDMLVFFGYNDGKTDDFKTKWLNFSWGRRIVSGIRLII